MSRLSVVDDEYAERLARMLAVLHPEECPRRPASRKVTAREMRAMQAAWWRIRWAAPDGLGAVRFGEQWTGIFARTLDPDAVN